ncbi:MAG TPA: ABC transporter permease [Actinoplanes sp.]|nr:ABC transporter permease [Actinoplanes sp.]
MSSLWGRAPGHRVQSWPAAPTDDVPGNPWFSWSYLHDNADHVLAALRDHAALTALAVIIAVVVALPLAVAAYWFRPLTRPAFVLTGALSVIPAVASLGLLVAFAGAATTTPVVTALAMYAVLLIVRHLLAGLTEVPAEVRDAAAGLGYSRLGRLLRIELPLALPAAFTGLRLATVSTVALVTVGALIGHGGLGDLILSGYRGGFQRAQITTGVLLCAGLAVTLDLLLLAAARQLTPWTREVRA